ncbi:hypothetical protein Hdeb2414_s0045g00744991 [Helianthus debilis subsp. tardiflorus]
MPSDVDRDHERGRRSYQRSTGDGSVHCRDRSPSDHHQSTVNATMINNEAAVSTTTTTVAAPPSKVQLPQWQRQEGILRVGH